MGFFWSFFNISWYTDCLFGWQFTLISYLLGLLILLWLICIFDLRTIFGRICKLLNSVWLFWLFKLNLNFLGRHIGWILWTLCKWWDILAGAGWHRFFGYWFLPIGGGLRAHSGLHSFLFDLAPWRVGLWSIWIRRGCFGLGLFSVHRT